MLFPFLKKELRDRHSAGCIFSAFVFCLLYQFYFSQVVDLIKAATKKYFKINEIKIIPQYYL